MPLYLDTKNKVKITGNVGDKKINEWSFIDFDDNGITIHIEPNFRGKEFSPREYLTIYCITKIMFTSVKYHENQLFQWQMSGINSGFALYHKTDDVREPPVIMLSFDEIKAELNNENSMVYFKVHLEHYFDEPYYNPLYEYGKYLLIDKGLFEIDLTIEIPIIGTR